MSELLAGNENEFTWNEAKFKMIVDDHFRNQISEMEDSFHCMAFVGECNLSQKNVTKLLKPVAWVYQLFLYVRGALRGGVTFQRYKAYEMKARLMDLLGVPQEDIGLPSFINCRFESREAFIYQKKN